MTSPLAAQVAPSLAINYAAYETLRSYCVPYARDRKTPTVRLSQIVVLLVFNAWVWSG